MLACSLPVLFPCLAVAGQSLVLTRGVSVPVIDPILGPNQSWRVEFQFHNWTLPPAGFYGATVFSLSGTGTKATISPDGRLAIEASDQVSLHQPCFLPTAGISNALVRIERNVATMQFSCEMWNYDGTGYRNDVMQLTQLQARPNPGGTIGGGATGALAFLRVSMKLTPLGGRPPTTADGGEWTELKLDGNLKDSSGHNHHGVDYKGPFMPTPGQLAFARPMTAGAPSWSSWTSLRAGFPAQLDASASYSMADASSSVSYSWQQTKGPTSVIWTGRDTVKPTVEGLVFGTYQFRLTISDAGGNTASATLETGAVATDDNGVVVNADPNVDRIFGPMIAFGRNPWGYADERALTAAKLRIGVYQAQGLDPPSWDQPHAGTVSYRFNGNGTTGGPSTTLSRAITAADTSLTVADASLLDLSSLPTRILVATGYNAREDMRICAASATKGPATLTVCFDGRGHTVPGDIYRTQPMAWPAGTGVGQMKVTGTGTHFLSDLCPAGPGPAGAVLYDKGTARMIPGSSIVAGMGTEWNGGSGARAGSMLRVSATHGGVPFVFTAFIASSPDPAHITLLRPYPDDADAGSFSYSIIQGDIRQMTLHYKRPADGSDAQIYALTSGCESDTAAYLYLGHDMPGVNGTMQTGMKYGFMDGFGYTSAYGADFYGEDLANRALYYRSGWDPALRAARVFGDHYVDSPQIDGGDAGGMTLLIGGGAVGGFVAAILDVNDPHRPSWTSLRGLARNGSLGGVGCNDMDTRDSGYAGTWLTLAAAYDPDPAQKAKWQNELTRLLARDERCKGADNSWAHGFLWNHSSAPLSVTKGSAIATGTNIPQGMCFGTGSGTIQMTAGSADATGTGLTPGNQLVIHGTRNGEPYTGFFSYQLKPGGSVQLGALWPGDSGTATFLIENADLMSAFAINNDDPQMHKNFACTWNSATQITLDRPWDGPTETGVHVYSYGLAGFGQQPFMLGIKITQMKFASQIPGAPFAKRYGELAAAAAKWIHDVGYDPVTQGLYYGRVFQACEPASVPPPGSAFDFRTPGCNYGLNPPAIRAARVLTAEASQALRVYYEANPTPEAKAWGDRAYGSIWGNPVYTTGGVYADSNYVRDENSDAALGAYKWTGFFFGMGMAHQWPAVRLGGVAPPKYRNVSLQIKPGAGTVAKTRVWVTAPSGETKSYQCKSPETCDVTVDDRQGSHWYVAQYLSADGAVLSQSDPALIAWSGGSEPTSGSHQ